jgi:hypothetical protein
MTSGLLPGDASSSGVNIFKNLFILNQSQLESKLECLNVVNFLVSLIFAIKAGDCQGGALYHVPL